MPPKRTLMILFSVLWCTAAAWAGLPLRPLYRVNMGIVTPLTPETLKTSHLSGFNVGAAVGTRLGERHQLSADFSYHNFSLNVQGYLSTLALSAKDEVESSATGGTAQVTTLFLQWKSQFPAPGEKRFIPYLFAETGLFYFSQQELQYWGPIGKDRSEPAAHSTAFGMGSGLGMEIAIEERSFLFIDLGVKIGFSEGERTAIFPVRVGVSFQR